MSIIKVPNLKTSKNIFEIWAPSRQIWNLKCVSGVEVRENGRGRPSKGMNYHKYYSQRKSLKNED